MDTSAIREAFETWRHRQGGALATALETEPPRPVVLDLTDLPTRDAEDALLDQPEDVFEIAREEVAAYRRDLSSDDIQMRVRGLPNVLHRQPSSLRGRDVGKLRAVEGLVVDVGQHQPVGDPAVWECQRCGYHVEIHGPGTPEMCPDDSENGCGRSTTAWEAVPEMSEYTARQRIHLTDPPDAQVGDRFALEVDLPEPLLGTCHTGDRVQINGVVRADQGETAAASFRLTAVDVLPLDHREIDLTDDDRDRLLETVESLDMPADAVASFAPNLVGLRREKLAVLLALATTPRPRNAVETPRGVAHVLLVGDPSTAKSSLLAAAADLAPFVERATGPQSTGPGLTGTTEKGRSGTWRTRPGALPRADGGVVVIDELGRLAEEHRNHLHEALAAGTVTISKAGGTVTWDARCSVVAAMNPVGDTFSAEGSIAEQTNLPASLLDRFDLVLPVQDDPDEDRDTRIAKAVLRRHAATTPDTALTREEMREVLVYGRELDPNMNEAARTWARDWWVHHRTEARTRRAALTARDLDAVLRLARGCARLRLDDQVIADDVRVATSLVEEYTVSVFPDKTTDLLRHIADLVDDGGGEWSGTATELMDAVDVDVPDPRTLGRQISELDAEGVWDRVNLSYEHNRSADARVHRFTADDRANGRGTPGQGLDTDGAIAEDDEEGR